ncbi:AraC family transcriptional regulator [Muricauda sp. CAU 1633]|uniref:helix-turn-helix domain-containing protein n=1 Tax=Allomuricauda sp. CAU 1633 TaxID=2816036 RepID=UPI001A8EE312|nr:helix-turn-helix domain-containing protein [Muricauda sp. CAU 1633]MBO0322904.1 AraC family transcriptional regulator [Muricauda sp. CAU 1633]
MGTLEYRSNKIIEERIGIVENTMVIISILYLIGLFEIILVFEENSTYLIYISIIACVLILIGLLKYMSKGLNYYNVVYSTPLSDEKFPELESDKYKSSSLSRKMAEQYVEELNELMTKERPFTNFDLTLAQLAKMLNMPERYLSQVINEYFHQNFYDFINSKRIEEAQRELRDKSKRISEIMYDVGFVSRSSFNTSFKKYVGMTPSEFRRKIPNS